MYFTSIGNFKEPKWAFTCTHRHSGRSDEMSTLKSNWYDYFLSYQEEEDFAINWCDLIWPVNQEVLKQNQVWSIETGWVDTSTWKQCKLKLRISLQYFVIKPLANVSKYRVSGSVSGTHTSHEILQRLKHVAEFNEECDSVINSTRFYVLGDRCLEADYQL